MKTFSNMLGTAGIISGLIVVTILIIVVFFYRLEVGNSFYENVQRWQEESLSANDTVTLEAISLAVNDGKITHKEYSIIQEAVNDRPKREIVHEINTNFE